MTDYTTGFFTSRILHDMICMKMAKERSASPVGCPLKAEAPRVCWRERESGVRSKDSERPLSERIIAQSERRISEMECYSIIMRQKHQKFRWYSFAQKLCSALLCSGETREKDLKHRML